MIVAIYAVKHESEKLEYEEMPLRGWNVDRVDVDLVGAIYFDGKCVGYVDSDNIMVRIHGEDYMGRMTITG